GPEGRRRRRTLHRAVSRSEAPPPPVDSASGLVIFGSVGDNRASRWAGGQVGISEGMVAMSMTSPTLMGMVAVACLILGIEGARLSAGEQAPATPGDRPARGDVHT